MEALTRAPMHHKLSLGASQFRLIGAHCPLALGQTRPCPPPRRWGHDARCFWACLMYFIYILESRIKIILGIIPGTTKCHILVLCYFEILGTSALNFYSLLQKISWYELEKCIFFDNETEMLHSFITQVLFV